MDSTPQNLSQYLGNVNNQYAKENSLTDILNSFRVMSQTYTDFNNKEIKTDKYSSPNYIRCTNEEQEEYYDRTLCKIETLVTENIYAKVGNIYDWGAIFNLIMDDNYALTEKIKRKMVFASSTTLRPINDAAYLTWNGLQIIDIDIKDAEIAKELKPLIFKTLCNHHWFLGCCLSASQKSLHVWTKITPITIDLEHRRTEFMCNFRHKYSYIYIAMMKYASLFGFTKDKLLQYIDMAMAKPQQGIFITSDKTAMMNMNFVDLRLDVNFEKVFDGSENSVDWINHPDLKETFAKLEWFAKDSDKTKTKEVEVSELSNIEERTDGKNIRRHYKHTQRWQLANTLNALYGYDKGLQYLIDISFGTDKKELRGDMQTARIHNKPISVWAVKELNKYHGFNIKLNNSDELEDIGETEPNQQEVIQANRSNYVELNIRHNQYLSDIKDEIMKELGNITILEAGAGYGKTEMIKAFRGKTLLILPFTSTIKSKVESSETTSDWLYYYGSKRPTLEDLLDNRSMSMTIDKFSNLNVMELDIAKFEYIVLDESHLLFTSSYRDVMSPTIQRLANCKARVIMMTGTPTGESLFFPNIKYIKVHKEDLRTKKFDLYITDNSIGKYRKVAKSICDDIQMGRKVLFPTNNGDFFYETLQVFIQEELKRRENTHEVKAYYYKKSNCNNLGSAFQKNTNDINIRKTIGDNDIICCTTFLSVGVDICDKYTFSVYFDETWIPQDIEQFANRLRNNDLFIKMYLPKYENEEDQENRIPINYSENNPLNLSFTEEDILFARDVVKLCNDSIERNKDESKYSPMVASFIGSNPYIKYDENIRKFYIDETTYKLHVFEERYSKYAKQLNVLTQCMKNYGYDVEIHANEEDEKTEDKMSTKEWLQEMRKKYYDTETANVLEFLSTLTDDNIELYKEACNGNYSILYDTTKNGIEGNVLYTKNIDIMEKNIDIVRGLYRFFTINTIVEIYKRCIDKKNGKLNYASLRRIQKLVSIEYNKQRNKLDIPIRRMIYDYKQWVRNHESTTRKEIDTYLAEMSAKYANTIPHVVNKDVKFLENVYEILKDLWSVVVDQSRPKKGNVTVKIAKLDWEQKSETNEDDMMGNFFGDKEEISVDDLLCQIKVQTEENTEEDEHVDYEFELTVKDKFEEVQPTLQDEIHKDYDYTVYSEQDGSNDRFLIKQTNTNRLKDTMLVTKQIENKDNNTTNDTQYEFNFEE